MECLNAEFLSRTLPCKLSTSQLRSTFWYIPAGSRPTWGKWRRSVLVWISVHDRPPQQGDWWISSRSWPTFVGWQAGSFLYTASPPPPPPPSPRPSQMSTYFSFHRVNWSFSHPVVFHAFSESHFSIAFAVSENCSRTFATYSTVAISFKGWTPFDIMTKLWGICIQSLYITMLSRTFLIEIFCQKKEVRRTDKCFSGEVEIIDKKFISQIRS